MINKHIIDERLPKELKKIGLIDSFIKKFNLPRSVLHMTRSELIDRVWVANSIVVIEMSIFPANFSTGNHRVILVDLNFNQIIERGVRACNPSMRRLSVKIKKLAWQLVQSCKVPQRLIVLEIFLTSNCSDMWCVKLSIIDKQITEIFLRVEKGCRKLRIGEV